MAIPMSQFRNLMFFGTTPLLGPRDARFVFPMIFPICEHFYFFIFYFFEILSRGFLSWVVLSKLPKQILLKPISHPTPKDSTVGEEVNTGQTKVSKTPKEKPREKRPTGIEVVRNQSNKEALAKELGKKESGNVAAPPPDSDNLAYNEDELQRIKEEEEVRKDMEYQEVPSSGDAESVKIIDEAINGEKTKAPIDINKPLNDEAGELADQENAFQKVFNKGKDVINNGVSAVGELFDGESPILKLQKNKLQPQEKM